MAFHIGALHLLLATFLESTDFHVKFHSNLEQIKQVSIDFIMPKANLDFTQHENVLILSKWQHSKITRAGNLKYSDEVRILEICFYISVSGI